MSLKDVGMAWRPFGEMQSNATYIDSKTGNIVKYDLLNPNSEVLVDAGTGEMIQPLQLFIDDSGNLAKTSIQESVLVLPYKYDYLLMPYHDTKRMYKVPVYNNGSNNPISPEDAKRFGIDWNPLLVGEDNWQEPSQNIFNAALAGGIAFPNFTTSVLTGELGGEAFNKLYENTHNGHTMLQDGVSSLYNLGYWLGGDVGYKGTNYLNNLWKNNNLEIIPYMLRTFGTKESRISNALNRNILQTTVPYRASVYDDSHFMDYDVPPEPDYDAMLELFYPAYGDRFTSTNGFSVATKNLGWYKSLYPNDTNVLWGPIAPKYDFHKAYPTIISDIPEKDITPISDYFNNVILPLARRSGYNLTLPSTKPKYYREIPYWEKNGLGVERRIPEVGLENTNEKMLGGWFNPEEGTSYINLLAPNKELTIIHEWLSHGTDSQISLADMKAYEDIAKFLEEHLPFRLIGDRNKFANKLSRNKEEVRATLNEARKVLIELGKIKINKDGTLDASELTSSDIMEILFNINSYGKDYHNMYYGMKNMKNQKQWINTVKRAMLYLPIAGGVVYAGSNN